MDGWTWQLLAKAGSTQSTPQGPSHQQVSIPNRYTLGKSAKLDKRRAVHENKRENICFRLYL
jgi:hypothetical protein